MTKMELLFREYRRSEPISYEEAKYAGLSTEDFLEYLRLCEELRSASICLHGLHKKLTKWKYDEIMAFKKAIISKNFSELSEWYTKYIGREIDVTVDSSLVELWANSTPYVPLGDKEDLNYIRLAASVLASPENFRYQIERVVSLRLSGDIAWFFGDDLDKISTKTLKKYREELDEAICNNERPAFPVKFESYHAIQEWASRFEAYYEMEHYAQGRVDWLDEEINSRFDQSHHTLYVFSGNPKCTTEHNVKCVTAIITGVRGEIIKLNVNYCSDCCRFFIKLSEYEHYMDKYGILPIRMTKIDGETLSTGYFRKQHSDLMLCGYNVSSGEGLTEAYRQLLLAHLLDSGVFSKYEIITHLDMLINTNGRSERNHIAKRKWQSDLDFVRDYQINNQQHVRIEDIKPGSGNLKKESEA